jgi:hypothetical protein
MLSVAAFELCHPIAVLVQMKAGNASFGNHESQALNVIAPSRLGPW